MEKIVLVNNDRDRRKREECCTEGEAREEQTETGIEADCGHNGELVFKKKKKKSMLRQKTF